MKVLIILLIIALLAFLWGIYARLYEIHTILFDLRYPDLMEEDNKFAKYLRSKK